MKIKVIANSVNSYASTRLIEEGKNKKHDIDVFNPADFYIMVSNVSGHDRIYNKETRLYLSDFDAIIPRLGGQKLFNYGLYVVEHLTNNMGIFSTASAEGLRTASDKMLTHQKLSQAKIKTPKTIFAFNPIDYDVIIEQVGGLPCVLKTITGSMGVGVMILETPLATKTLLQSLYKSDFELIFQEYLEAGGKDIRAIVIGGEFVTAFQRNANKGDFRANLAQGGYGEKITLTETQKQIAIDSANAVGLECAGVDMVVTNKGTYVIEVNGNFNLEGVEKVTGINVAKKIIEYTEQNAKEHKARTETEAKILNEVQTHIRNTLAKNSSLLPNTSNYLKKYEDMKKFII